MNNCGHQVMVEFHMEIIPGMVTVAIKMIPKPNVLWATPHVLPTPVLEESDTLLSP